MNYKIIQDEDKLKRFINYYKNKKMNIELTEQRILEASKTSITIN